jgi:Domain of unknown function (DUF1929)
MTGEGCVRGVAAFRRCIFSAPVERSHSSRVSDNFKVAIILMLAFVTGSALPDNVNGGWLSPVADNWPFVPLHAALTPDGRVLTYGSGADGAASGFFSYDVWDPADGLSGGHTTLENMTLTDIFCSYAVILPTNGNLLIAGGDNWNGSAVENTGNDDSNIFAPSDNLLTRAIDMRRSRWYATATPMMNGEIYIQGGKDGGDVAELRDVFGQFHTLSGVLTGNMDWWYPCNFLAPDGRVFGFDVDAEAYYVDPAGLGTITTAGTIGTTNVARGGPSVMFRPGKILQVAGKNRNAVVIDIDGPQPLVTPTKSLAAKRVWASLTVLPDGRVVATGGSGLDEQLVNVTNYAEIWDPQSGKWTSGASGSRARLYHSVALLLPDASVLVAGGGASDKAPVNQLHGEIYYPPYLFNSSGNFAARPSIDSAPHVLAAGQSFTMEVDTTTIQRVTLLQLGMSTHSINLQQRFSELTFTKDGQLLHVNMPARPTDVPPGYYMLFALNGSGVPSKAKIVRINVAGGSGGGGDEVPPTTPQNLTISKVNGNPKLTWTVSTDAVGVTGYSIHRATGSLVGPEIALATTTTWIDTSVVEGTKYWYAVKAYDAAGNLSSGSTLKSIVAYAKPTKPSNFTVSLSSGDPKLTFSASTDNVGVVGYNVYRSTNGTLGSLFAQIGGSPWVDTSAQAGVTYTYAVRARDAAGYLSAATALKSVTAK